MPAQVVENNSSIMDGSILPQSSELEGIIDTTVASDDSDTLKIYDLNKNEANTTEKIENVETKQKEISTVSTFNRLEGYGNVATPARRSTPTAFKFLQPKRRLLEPNQILSVDEDNPYVTTTSQGKPVIEEELIKALPSVKALARAFLTTTNTHKSEKLWLRKARISSQNERKKSTTTRSLDPNTQLSQSNVEDDVTINSDLSSLETDSSLMCREAETTNDLITPIELTMNETVATTKAISSTSPLPVRQGVLKSNIAFFENLKNK